MLWFVLALLGTTSLVSSAEPTAGKCVLCLVPQMDTDGSGEVSRAEVTSWIRPRLAKLQYSKAQDFGTLTVDGLATEMMAAADLDKSGSLSMDEVQSSIHENAAFEMSKLHEVLHFEM